MRASIITSRNRVRVAAVLPVLRQSRSRRGIAENDYSMLLQRRRDRVQRRLHGRGVSVSPGFPVSTRIPIIARLCRQLGLRQAGQRTTLAIGVSAGSKRQDGAPGPRYPFSLMKTSTAPQASAKTNTIAKDSIM
jgi:hypothetical protein